MDIEVIDVELRIALEKMLFVVETESQSLETLEEEFHVLLWYFLLRLFIGLKIENVFCIVCCVFIKIISLSP